MSINGFVVRQWLLGQQCLRDCLESNSTMHINAFYGALTMIFVPGRLPIGKHKSALLLHWKIITSITTTLNSYTTSNQTTPTT